MVMMPLGGTPVVPAQRHQRRLDCLYGHVCAAAEPATPVLLKPAAVPRPPTDDADDGHLLLPPALTPLSAQQLKDYISRGVVVIPPEDQGAHFNHGAMCNRMHTLHSGNKIPAIGYYDHFPELAEILSTTPGVNSALNAILGQRWAFQPFIHSMFAKVDGPGWNSDQTWHKDDNAAYNGRKFRHHRPVQAELLYYPQDVGLTNGPTYVVPYSHYWTTDHEENQANFSGPDHLGFFDPAAEAGEARTRQLEGHLKQLGWPLVQPHAVTVKAGTFVIISHNTYHRASRFLGRQPRPRFMWRMYCFRTSEPGPAPASCAGCLDELSGGWAGADSLVQGVDLTASAAAVDATTRDLWDAHLAYCAGLPRPTTAAMDTMSGQTATTTKAVLLEKLETELTTGGEPAEPARLAAAMALAMLAPTQLHGSGGSGSESAVAAISVLLAGLQHDRESTRRAACYGLCARTPADDAQTQPLLSLTTSISKSTRKHACFVLGETALLATSVVDALAARLLGDRSAFVRAIAAGALGCIAIRSFGVAQNGGSEVASGREHIGSALAALLRSLEQEENRQDVTERQGIPNLKHCAPDDVCDICEGSTWHVGQGGYAPEPRLQPVRSAVRENVLWALVQICSHGEQLEAAAKAGLPHTSSNGSGHRDPLAQLLAGLEHIGTTDTNVCTVGYAMDALQRLRMFSNQQGTVARSADDALRHVLGSINVRCPETLLRSGPLPPY